MSENDRHLQDTASAAAHSSRRVDFEDLNRELAGINVKENRFLRADDERTATGRARKEREAVKNQLQIMLTDPAYHAAYMDTMNALNEADSAVYDALVEAANKVRDTNGALEEAETRGASEAELEALQKTLDEAKERHERMTARDKELAEIRVRMEDPDNPPTQEEMERYRKHSKEIEAEATSNTSYEQSLEASQPQENAVEVPDLDLGGFTPPA